MTQVEVRTNKKYIQTSRNKVKSIKENKINSMALTFFVAFHNAKKWLAPKDFIEEMQKDGVDVIENTIYKNLNKLAGLDKSVAKSHRRNELKTKIDSKTGKRLYKFNPKGKVRCRTTEALRIISYNNTSRAEFIQ